MRRNEKSKKDSTMASDQPGTTNTGTNSTTTDNAEDLLGESNKAMTASTGEVAIGDIKATATEPSTTTGTTTTTTTVAGKDNAPKEDKQLVYAELVLKPSDNNPPMPSSKNSTEYAEIVYVQKPTPGTAAVAATTAEKIDSKGKK